MKGKYKLVIALLLIVILLPLALLLTVVYWLPPLAGLGLPQGTHIVLQSAPQVTRKGISVPAVSYFAGDCQLASVQQATINYSAPWKIHLNRLDVNPDCARSLPVSTPDTTPPHTLAQWQTMLPVAQLTIEKLNVMAWPQLSGKLSLSTTVTGQQLNFVGPLLTFTARLQGQQFVIEQLKTTAVPGVGSLELLGKATLAAQPDGLPEQGQLAAKLSVTQLPQPVDVVFDWHNQQGELTLRTASQPEPIARLPWRVTRESVEIEKGQWQWPVADVPLRGGIGLRIDNWQQGLEKAVVSGRINVVTQGKVGKANAVLNIGPGTVSMQDSQLPLRLTGEAKRDALVFYAQIPGAITGALTNPQLILKPGALLRANGYATKSLAIDEIRWPLAGIHLNQQGVNGRLQAIIRAHESQIGNVALHLDGRASQFLPDAGLWQWRYWGNGFFTPMQGRWDVSGKGEWRDSVIELASLSSGFDKLAYGTMRVSEPRLTLTRPVRWQRTLDQITPNQNTPNQNTFSGGLVLQTGKTDFTSGSQLHASTLNFNIDGQNPGAFQFSGNLQAGKIGPVRLSGRWGEGRLRGNVWWPEQSLEVFQPLIPPETKMKLVGGTLYAQVAFSAASQQGFVAGGHGVVKEANIWLPGNQIQGVNFVLPFRFGHSLWNLGTRGPVKLRIDEIRNQVVAKNIRANLQGTYPWSNPNPLILSKVSVEVLGGKISMQQLRMPQQDAALLRLQNISTSEIISAINPKQFTMSGRVNGALPLWLNNSQWIIKDGWLSNPGSLTFRMDKDMADALIANNPAAVAGISWLRYMEVSRMSTRINLDNVGEMTLSSEIHGISHVEEKKNRVNLNYTHQENIFTLWRSLRFGDNLQTWLEQNATLPVAHCQPSAPTCEDTP